MLLSGVFLHSLAWWINHHNTIVMLIFTLANDHQHYVAENGIKKTVFSSLFVLPCTHLKSSEPPLSVPPILLLRCLEVLCPFLACELTYRMGFNRNWEEWVCSIGPDGSEKGWLVGAAHYANLWKALLLLLTWNKYYLYWSQKLFQSKHFTSFTK